VLRDIGAVGGFLFRCLGDRGPQLVDLAGQVGDLLIESIDRSHVGGSRRGLGGHFQRSNTLFQGAVIWRGGGSGEIGDRLLEPVDFSREIGDIGRG